MNLTDKLNLLLRAQQQQHAALRAMADMLYTLVATGKLQEGLTLEEVRAITAVAHERLSGVVNGTEAMDAEIEVALDHYSPTG